MTKHRSLEIQALNAASRGLYGNAWLVMAELANSEKWRRDNPDYLLRMDELARKAGTEVPPQILHVPLSDLGTANEKPEPGTKTPSPRRPPVDRPAVPEWQPRKL